jgi:hypothetical protein
MTPRNGGRRLPNCLQLATGLVVGFAALTGGTAHADSFSFSACLTGTPCIDFGNTRQPGGTISYDGEGGPLVGQGVPILSIAGLSTPANSWPATGTLTVVDGQLNFATGELVESRPSFGYEFGAGGYFTITGAVPDLGVTDSSTVLVEGVFTGALYGAAQPSPAQFLLFTRGTDVKNDLVMSYFGLVPGTPMSFGGGILTEPVVGGLDGGPFSVGALNVDIPNQPAPVPEPATLLLLGSGLSVAAIRARRRAGDRRS